MKILLPLTLTALAVQIQGKLASYESVEELNSVIDFYSSMEAKDVGRKLEEETPVICVNDYEIPQDKLAGPVGDSNADEWLASQEWKTFTSKVGKPTDRQAKDVVIEYVKCTGPGTKGAMVFVPGQSEATTKHSEQIYDVIQAGYSPVYSIDHRGQGKSSRLLDNELKGYVELGEDFVTDLRDYINIIVGEVQQTTENRLFGICHS